MSTGSSMKTDVGDSANRNGLVLASGAAATDKTYTIDLTGRLSRSPARRAFRLEGNELFGLKRDV